MEEYRNIDFSKIKCIRKENTIYCKYNNKSYISFNTPPLFCKSIKISKDEKNAYLYLENTDNNFLFESTLERITKKCKKIIKEKSKRWFSVTMDAPIEDGYYSLFEYSKTRTHYDNIILVPIHKKYLQRLSKNDLRRFKNNTLIIQLVFSKIQIQEDDEMELIERWVATNIQLSNPDYDSDTDDFKDDFKEDFEENLQFIKEVVSHGDNDEDIEDHNVQEDHDEDIEDNDVQEDHDAGIEDNDTGIEDNDAGIEDHDVGIELHNAQEDNDMGIEDKSQKELEEVKRELENVRNELEKVKKVKKVKKKRKFIFPNI